MKFIFKNLIYLGLLFPSIFFAQSDDLICGVTDYTPLGPSTFSGSIDPAVLNSYQPVVFNIKYWQINDENGDYGADPNITDLSEEEVLESVAYLNIFFNQYNIFFKYRGIDQFNSPPNVILKEWDYAYSRCSIGYDEDGNPIYDEDGFTFISKCQSAALYQFALANGYMLEENINIYVPYGAIDFGGLATNSNPKLVLPRFNLSKTTMIHEMGHALNLLHPHKNFRNENPEGSNEDYDLCERVTKNPLDEGEFNADTHGDSVVDTAASPDLRREHFWELIDQGYTPNEANDMFIPYAYVDEITCDYTGDGTDCSGDFYNLNSSDTRNIMSYTRVSCRQDFTIGQGIRMRESIEDFWFNYGPKTTDIESLYEPYKGEYYLAGPITNHSPPLFQPGFEYRFVECSGDYPQPAVYSEPFSYDLNTILLNINKDETNYNSITHPNHSAILIKHQYNGNEVFPQPQKCYNNFNKASNGGLIMKFNDNVFNNNITITPQDSTSINNQNLIQNLENGLYKIEKSYNDGSIEETIIIKEND